MDEPTSTLAPTQAVGSPKPFRFYTSLVLQESTGLRAGTLPALVKLLRLVPETSIYYHTHYFLLQHQYLAPEPTNDFAYWVGEVLGDRPLGERLASVDTMAYANLHDLREELARTIDAHLEAWPMARLRFAAEGSEFFFLKSVHVVMPTPYTASTLAEFAQALERVSLASLYFHMFDARLRLGQPTNDFARWFAEQLGLAALAEHITHLDPYAYTLETLRATLLAILREHLGIT